MAITVCGECDHKVSDRAASCPSCGAPLAVKSAVLQRGQRALIGAVIAVAVLALVGTEFWFDTLRSQGHRGVISKPSSMSLVPTGPAAASQPPGEVTASTRTVYQTTAERLYQDYAANGVATQSKIANSRVRITGKIAAIDEDAAGAPVVKLAASNDDSVSLTLGEDEIAAAAQLSRGQTVDVQCDRVHRVMGSPEGSQCSLLLVQGTFAAPPVAARAVSAAPASELNHVAAAGAGSGRKSRKSLPATTIALVPAAPSLSTDDSAAESAPGSAAATPVTAVEKSAAPSTPLASIPLAPVAVAPGGAQTGAPAAAAPEPSAPPATTSAPEQRDAEARATPERATPSAESGAFVPDASRPATSSPAMLASDDLALVRAADPQAADHIASYCASTSTATGAGAATCRRDEKEAWTRLVQNNEFPALDEATRLKCSQPPFPDSFRAKEICAKYELRIY